MRVIKRLTRDIERLENDIAKLEERMEYRQEQMRAGKISKAELMDYKRKFKTEVVGLRGAIKKKEKARPTSIRPFFGPDGAGLTLTCDF